MQRPNHLFLLDWNAVGTMDYDAINATVRDLKEMSLYHLPYDDQNVYVRVIGNPEKPGTHITYGPLGEFCDVVFGRNADSETVALRFNETRADIRAEAAFSALVMQDTLIALLATRNIEKSMRENKLRKLGIGKGRARFDYTTTISLPKDLPDDDECPSSGGPRVPHLRRGHIRYQHHGPRNELVKRIWIAPIFVNADPAFIGGRKAYKIAV